MKKTYKPCSNAETFKELGIPTDVEVLDLSDCRNLEDLNGLKECSRLWFLILSRTQVTGRDLQNIPDSVRAVDIRNCSFITSLTLVHSRPKDKPLHILSDFRGERFQLSTPDGVDLDTASCLTPKEIAQKRQEFISVLVNMQKVNA